MTDWFPLWLSVRVALAATVVAGAAGVGAGYVLAKARFRGRGLLEAALSLPIVLPPTVLGYYLLVALGRNSPVGRAWEAVFGAPLVFTAAGAVVAATVSALPFCVRTARAAFEQVEPQVEQAARSMGLPEWRVALQVTLPLARRGVVAGVALGLARALGDFGATVMVAGNIPGRTQTMPVALYDAVQAGDGARASTLALVLASVAVALLLLVNRFSRSAP